MRFKQLFLVFVGFCLFIALALYIYSSHSATNHLRDAHTRNETINTENCTNRNPNEIAVLVVIDKRDYLKDYSLAHKTITCYCAAYNYSLNYVYLKNNTNSTSKCNQANFYLQRHCAVVEFMQVHSNFKWILFIDADIGVINPRHTLEEFIHKRTEAEVELIFYERLITWEFMAGTYLAKNTPFVHNFLMEWANYTSNKNYHQDDEGPLHQVFINRFEPSTSKKLVCDQFYNSTKTYKTYLEEYVTCARHILGVSVRFFGNHIKLIRRGDAWARDGHSEVTSYFADRDFMFHFWKDKAAKAWKFPFLNNNSSTAFAVENCRVSASRSRENVFNDNWQYKMELKKCDEEVEEIIAKIRNNSHFKYLNALERLKI